MPEDVRRARRDPIAAAAGRRATDRARPEGRRSHHHGRDHDR